MDSCFWNRKREITRWAFSSPFIHIANNELLFTQSDTFVFHFLSLRNFLSHFLFHNLSDIESLLFSSRWFQRSTLGLSGTHLPLCCSGSVQSEEGRRWMRQKTRGQIINELERWKSLTTERKKRDSNDYGTQFPPSTPHSCPPLLSSQLGSGGRALGVKYFDRRQRVSYVWKVWKMNIDCELIQFSFSTFASFSLSTAENSKLMFTLNSSDDIHVLKCSSSVNVQTQIQ